MSKCRCCSFFWRVYWCTFFYLCINIFFCTVNRVYVFWAFCNRSLLVGIMLLECLFCMTMSLVVLRIDDVHFVCCLVYIQFFFPFSSCRSLCCVTFFPCTGHILVFFIIFIITENCHFSSCFACVVYCTVWVAFFFPVRSLYRSFHFGVYLYLVNW